MVKTFSFLVLAAFLSYFAAGQVGEGQHPSCPFHLCTAELLRCADQHLEVDERGCEQCRCRASRSSRNSSCPLHGCTVGLLGCSAGLRRNERGCTLCECEEGGNVLPGAASVNPIIDGSNSTDLIPPSRGASNICPALECETICERYRRSPLTGCPVCECEEGIGSIDLCPNSQDLTSGDDIRRGENVIVSGSIVPKYKIALGKLRKGFLPNHSYKVALRSLNNNFPFKEFLLELAEAQFTVRRTTKRGRERTKTVPIGSSDQRTSSDRRREGCGAGYWMLDDSVQDSTNWRPFPDCTTAATESDKSENKSSVALIWVAPRCGCVHIRSSVIDHSGRTVYYDDVNSAPANGFDQDSSSSSRSINRPLFRTVCAKTQSKRKRGSRRNNKRRKGKRKQKNWIAVKCCLNAKGQRPTSNNCQRKSIVRSATLRTRFAIERKMCKAAYYTCCLLGKSNVIVQQPSRGNGTSTSGRGGLRRGNGRKSPKRNPGVSVQLPGLGKRKKGNRRRQRIRQRFRPRQI